MELTILTVKELPLDDRPREKLILKGAQSLSDAELLAILLRVGTRGRTVIEVARELLTQHRDLAMLATKSVGALIKTVGIGKDKAATLVAVFELSRRVNSKQNWFKNRAITSPEDVAEIFIPLLKNEVKESFIVASLNSANKIIKYDIISTGSLSASIVHPREVFKVAIENSAASIILIHNHPSGNTEPSREDILVTKKIAEAAKIFEIDLFDHIIVAENNYCSLVEKKHI